MQDLTIMFVVGSFAAADKNSADLMQGPLKSLPNVITK